MEDELEDEMKMKEGYLEVAQSAKSSGNSKERKMSESGTPKKVKFDDNIIVTQIEQIENEVNADVESDKPSTTEGSGVTYEDEEDTDSEKEFETGERCTKKRVHYTNDELFYDPDRDEKDEDWINARRKT